MAEAVQAIKSRKPLSGPAWGGFLERVALALNSTLELKEVLRLLAEIALEFTGGQRCSLFLLKGRELRPAVAIGTWSDEDLWSAFTSMEVKPLDPYRWKLLRAGRAVAIEDARTSDLIPADWLDRFSLRAIALVPLMAAGEPCGLMAVDWPHPRSFDDQELRRLEAIGSYAGVAVRNARLFDDLRRRAQLQEALARSAAALASPLQPEEIAQRLVDSYLDLLGAKLCAIGLFDPERTEIRTIASRGACQIERPLPIADIPAGIVSRLVGQWTASKIPVAFDDDPWFAEFVGGRKAGASHYLTLPLVAGGSARGVVLLGFSRRSELEAEERSAAEALAAIASAAFERHNLLEQLDLQIRRLDAVYRLSTLLTERTDSAALAGVLNDLLSSHGIEVIGMIFRDQNLAKRLSSHLPKPQRRGVDPPLDPSTNGSLAIPMRLGRRSVGTLLVRPAELEPEQRSFLEALGQSVAEVATRAALKAAVDEAERERVLAVERERMASDLHDAAGQTFVAVGLLSRRFAEELPPDSPWGERILRIADLAERGKWEIDQAIRALTFVPAGRRGLVAALRALARSLEADSGIPVFVEVAGRPVRLGARVERALYRVCHEALANAWRHARCGVIRVEVDFTQSEIALRILDDGIGLRAWRSEVAPRLGLASMRKAMEEVGGSLRVRNAEPRGVLVEARVPRKPR